MPTLVERIGGIARLAHEPRNELESMRPLTEPGEFARWLIDFEHGDLVVVTVELFADVVVHGVPTRITDHELPGLSFYRGHPRDNAEHAADVVQFGVDGLCTCLRETAIETTPEHLLRYPVAIEIDPDLAPRLAAH